MKLNFHFLILLPLLASFSQVAAQVTFAPVANYAVGEHPCTIVSADINGDGKLDLICANALANTLSVLTNNGSGGFMLASSPGVGNGPISVAAADFNGDGKPDLVCPNYSDNTLTVLTNTGNGGFVSNATYSAGIFPYSVIATDVNGDGKLDLVCANSEGNALTILTNKGNGSFAPAPAPMVPLGSISVVAADINSDGKPDLISASSPYVIDGVCTLTVFTNNGKGIFVSNATLNVDSAVYSVTSADVNSDGKPDLICADFGSYTEFNGTLSVFTNNGNGHFALSSLPTVGGGPISVTAVDINGDGKVDLISANWTFGTLTVLTNNGSGGFVVAASPIVGTNARWVTAADVNKDGRPDLICANFSDNTLSVLINVPTIAIKYSVLKFLGNRAIISWPAAWTNWTLQQNSNLATTNWSASGYRVTTTATTKSVTITSPANSLFFRLSHP